MAKFKIAVLISGGGTTLKNLLEFKQAGRLQAEIVQVVSSSAKAKGNALAEDNDIPLAVIERKQFATDLDFSKAIFERCGETELVVMGGFLKRIEILSEFENRVINIHPSLIPAFSGHGFYGLRVHESVIEYGCRISGCTVHFVDNEYDHGPIISQRSLPVQPSDTPQSLAKRVFELECQLYPEVINLIANGLVSVVGRKVLLALA